MQTADANPSEVEAQMAAAFANDRYGSETAAMPYYDAAWALGIPADKRNRFMVGYGSTLRNNGRLDESLAVHRQAIADYPDFAAHHAFLALVLNDLDRHDEAVAAALTDAASENLDGYDLALRQYRDVLADKE
jgi:tetratricopeptide (TPR) repeat protein